MMRFLRSVLILVALLAALAPVAALACGMPLSARIPSEQALIVFANGREEIITSVHLRSDKPGAAVVFPVPGVPEVDELGALDHAAGIDVETWDDALVVHQPGATASCASTRLKRPSYSALPTITPSRGSPARSRRWATAPMPPE